MDRMTSLRVFRDVVESGSFTAAAERQSMSPPMVSKHIAQLEKSLGARLLNRSSRHLSLTEAGTAWYEQSGQALDMLDAAQAAIGQRNETPRGRLKVSAPVWCATPRFARVLAGYRERYPDVLIDIHLENRKIDLAADGYDLALRATQEPSAALIARSLCKVQFHLVAATDYVLKAGEPSAPADLAKLDAIVPSYVNIEGLSLKGSGGRLAPLRLRPVMLSDDTTLTLHAVRAGMGMAFLPEWLVDDDLVSGMLTRLVPEYAAPAVTLFAVYTSRQYMAPKLRSFIDFLSERLNERLSERASAPASASVP